MSDLKPCPFCGGKAILEDYGLNGNFKIVKCTECGARTKLFLKGLILGEDAREAWNRRAKDEDSTITPERKPGRWMPHEDEDGEHYGDKCSVCGEWYVMPFGKTNFCPNCGADMRGEKRVND